MAPWWRRARWAVNDPATAVQVLDTIESLLQALVSRDLDVADVADDAGTVRVVLALPSWDDGHQPVVPWCRLAV